MGGEPEARASGEEAAWTAAQRVEEWAGEVRVNLIRLVAIALFYGHHLLNYHVLKLPLTPDFHLAATGVAAAWTAAALALHAGLQPRWNPPWLKFATVAFDALMLTSLLVLTDGARSPLVAVLFLLVATAPLRLRRSLVWAATVLALLSFLFVCGHDRWVRGLPAEQRLPRPQQVITGIALACAGVLAGQSVRQARRFARDYADRVRPEEAA